MPVTPRCVTSKVHSDCLYLDWQSIGTVGDVNATIAVVLGNGYTRLRYGAPVHVTNVHLEFRPEQVVPLKIALNQSE